MTWRVAVLLLVVSTLSCRTSRYQRRGVEEPFQDPVTLGELENDRTFRTQLDFEARSIERYKEPRFTVGILEFNDEGQFHPMQRDQVIRMVSEELGRPDEP